MSSTPRSNLRNPTRRSPPRPKASSTSGSTSPTTPIAPGSANTRARRSVQPGEGGVTCTRRRLEAHPLDPEGLDEQQPGPGRAAGVVPWRGQHQPEHLALVDHREVARRDGLVHAGLVGRRKTFPISNRRMSPWRRAVLVPTARNRPGSRLWRSTDSPSTSGLATVTPPVRPVRSSSPGGSSDCVQASCAPRPAMTSRTKRRSRWYGGARPPGERGVGGGRCGCSRGGGPPPR